MSGDMIILEDLYNFHVVNTARECICKDDMNCLLLVKNTLEALKNLCLDFYFKSYDATH